MHSLLKMFGKTISCVSIIAFASACFAAENVRTAAAGAGGTSAGRGRGTSSAVRMPSMPILSFSAVGNATTSNPVTYVTDNVGTNSGIVPGDQNDNNGGNNNGGNNNNNNDNNGGDNNGGLPAMNCDLSYTIDSCMADIYACVNSGALPSGINSMFDKNLRDSIIAGMGLCQSQVDYCIANVRLPKNDGTGCIYLYGTARDVWYDFNARRVQPEYYNFVLRRTGLTPAQAENTCLLLDRNTYGASFDAVATGDDVTSEYGNSVYAYNNGAGNKSGRGKQKSRTMGPEVNENGSWDDQRGYYARWDAQNAQCLVRVAAYNKDNLITNRVLFGAIGDDSPAEVWKSTGESFTCNKDLFGFSLRKATETTAIIAVPLGTAVGIGTAAAIDKGKEAGKGKDKKLQDMCGKEGWRRQITEQLRKDNYSLSVLRQFLDEHELYKKGSNNGGGNNGGSNNGGANNVGSNNVGSNNGEGVDKSNKANLESGKLSVVGPIIDESTCKNILTVFQQYYDGWVALVENCEYRANNLGVDIKDPYIQLLISNGITSCQLEEKAKALCEAYQKLNLNDFKTTEEFRKALKEASGNIAETEFETLYEKHMSGVDVANGVYRTACNCKDSKGKTLKQTELDQLNVCHFKNMNLFTQSADAMFCSKTDKSCVGYSEFKRQIDQLGRAYKNIEDLLGDTGKISKKQKAKDMAIGGAIGAATGGTATLIAAFVEGSRINCRVGDDLARVDLNKSYTIDRLRDFYVKWALNMPITTVETNTRDVDVVTNCGNWEAICNAKGDDTSVNGCDTTNVNYLPTGVYTPQFVQNACKYDATLPAGHKCGINWTNAARYGIMGRDVTCPAPTVNTNVGNAADNAATAMSQQNASR